MLVMWLLSVYVLPGNNWHLSNITLRDVVSKVIKVILSQHYTHHIFTSLGVNTDKYMAFARQQVLKEKFRN